MNHGSTAMTLALPRALMVRASAGTGKTYQLTGRLLATLGSGASPDSLLATTFTRKAAGEILERVLSDLARAVLEPAALAELRKKLGQPNLTAEDVARLLHRTFRELHRLRISTLDSFFQQIARSLGGLIGLPPGWRLTDEFEEANLRERAVDQLIAEIEPAEMQSLMAMLQKGETARSIHIDLIKLAAGCYEQWRLTPREAWDTIDVPPLPDKSTIEAATLALRSIDPGHGSTKKVLANLADYLDHRDWLALAESSLASAVFTPIDDPKYKRYYGKELPDDLWEVCRTLAAIAQHAVLRQVRDQTLATHQLLTRYAQCLENVRQKTQAFSFGDITVRLADRVQATAEHSDHWLASQLEHILLDEFQDTSRVQWQVLRPMVNAALAAPTGSFFCVGDTKQAIYGWRGGDARLFDEVVQSITPNRCEASNISYRSSPIVLNFINEVFQNLTRFPRYQTDPDRRSPTAQRIAARGAEFARLFPVHQAADPSMPGLVEIHTTAAVPAKPKRDDPDQPAAVKPDALVVATAARLIQSIAAEHPDASIGVLVRRNRTVAQLIAQLQAAGCPASQEGGNPLTDSLAVRVVLAALRLCEHPGDRRQWFLLQHSPLSDHLGLTETPPSPVVSAATAYAAARRLRDRLEHDGLINTLNRLAECLLSSCDAGDLERLEQLIQLAEQFVLRPGPRWSDFVRLVETRKFSRSRPERIRVMTIHQAKGLEFDAVVLAELHQDWVSRTPALIERFEGRSERPTAVMRYQAEPLQPYLASPWRMAIAEAASEKEWEALCGLYVALTRARRAIYLVITPQPPGKPAANAANLICNVLGQSPEMHDPTEAASVVFRRGTQDWAKDHLSAAAHSESPSSAAEEKELPFQFRATGEEPTNHDELPTIALWWESASDEQPPSDDFDGIADSSWILEYDSTP
jgi:ATP-dependent exoDNAse (exonuclease V) beta subunit